MMKKIQQIVFVFLITMLFSQEKEVIKFKGNIWNYENGGREYATLSMIDQRDDKQIGILPFGDNNDLKEVVFSPTLNDDLAAWYRKSNQNSKDSKYEIVLLLKKLKLSAGEKVDKKTIGTIDFSIQSFSKKGDEYNFLYKKDTVFTFLDKDISSTMVKNVPVIFSVFLRKTYAAKPAKDSLTIAELNDYESYRINSYNIYKDEPLKDGVYLDHTSFFNQTPEKGNYILQKNRKGRVLRASGGNNTISAAKMFAYVENGTAYKNVLWEFLPIQRNEKGFFVIANKGDLIPKPTNIYGMYGLTGALMNMASGYSKQMKSYKKEKEKVYIDPLTGEYDFSGEGLN